MLCPECKCPAPGGSPCPQCHRQVPEKEVFGGQGRLYLYVLAGLAVLLFTIFTLIFGKGIGFRAASRFFLVSSWFWLYVLISFLPLLIGLYYWFILRDEEITVTDTYIARRSHWGDELMLWGNVAEYRRQTILLSQTRLGRVAALSRFFGRGRLLARLPSLRYELIAFSDERGSRHTLALDPGTVDDMAWLLSLIEERLGPPIDA